MLDSLCCESVKVPVSKVLSTMVCLVLLGMIFIYLYSKHDVLMCEA
jgi:hypothetical protein